MAAVLQVEPHPASVDAYIRNGWSLVPIPPGSKGPRTVGWNKRDGSLKTATDLPPGWGIGLAHAYSGTMALDVDDHATATGMLALHGVDLAALLAAPDAVAIDSSNPGHGKLLFTMPFGITLPTKKVMLGGKTVYELRCSTADGLTTQDVLPPSIHPGTQQPYRWVGSGDWRRLPTIPTALLDLWQSLLQETTAPVSDRPTTDVNWREVESALAAIDPSCSREEWIAVGMALHGADPEAGLALWMEWSRGSESKFPGDRVVAAQWRSFRDDKPNKVTLGSLFALARDAGWVKPPVDVSALFSSTEAQTPTLLRDSIRPPLPQVRLDLFPPVLARRASEVSRSIGCDPLVPLFAGLGAVCAVADGRSRLEIVHKFAVPPLLWLLTIGDPGDKKTPGADPMLEPLAVIEREDRPRYAKAVLEWEMIQAIWVADSKAALDWAKSPERGLSEPPALKAEPPHPVPLRLTVNDITSQKLVRHGAERPQGFLCALDEMAGWARKIGDARSGEDRSAWTAAYNGKRYEMDRVGAGTIIADPFCVSIYGNIQPRVYRDHMSNLSIDGLLQRFIPAILDSSKTCKGKPMQAHETNETEWEMLLRTVHALPTATYTLHPDAYDLFDQFQSWYDERRRDERLLMADDSYREALGKVEGTVGRMALVFHLIEAPFSTVISADTMERAIAFVRGYVIPALRYSLGEFGGVSSFDQWLADWIISHADEQTVSLSTIKRASHRQTPKVGGGAWAIDQLIIGAMRLIEQAGWVARIDDGEQEHRHQALWAINPALLKQFDGYRRDIIAARQRRLDEMYRDNPYGRTKFAHGYKPEDAP